MQHVLSVPQLFINKSLAGLFYRVNKTQPMSLQKVIIAASAGVAAGLVIGLLAAPAKGNDTRQQLADDVTNWYNELFGKGATAQTGHEETLTEKKERILAKIKHSKPRQEQFVTGSKY